MEWKNTTNSDILYLRLNAVHQLYWKEVSTREGVDVIGENTLRNYFKSKKYFIGTKKSMNFEDTSTSAYIFNYSMMEAQGILNLVRGTKTQSIFDETESSDPAENPKGLPF